MKVLLYASLSANGFLLLATNSKHELTPETLIDFMNEATKSKNIVMGRKTYDLLAANPAAKESLAGIDIVVISRSCPSLSGVRVVRSPNDAVNLLQKDGYKTLLLAGGAEIYSAFIMEGLVDTVLLNMHPILTGQGGAILNDPTQNLSLRLAGIRKLNQEVVQLRYERTIP